MVERGKKDVGGGWVTRLTSLGHVTGEETRMVHINTQLKTSMGGGRGGGGECGC